MRKHVKDEMKKTGSSYANAQDAMLAKHSDRVQDERKARGGTVSYRYAGV